MVEPVLTRQRVDADQLDRLREWMAEVRARTDDHVATLEDEGSHTESAFLETIDGAWYLTCYMEADDFEAAVEAYRGSDHAIDEEHKAVMRAVLDSHENVADTELLYHAVSPDRHRSNE